MIDKALTNFSAYLLVAYIAFVASCISSKTPYVSDAQANDLPPSPRYRVA